MKNLVKITVRKEGHGINSMWDFEYCDGSKDSYYAYESSAQSDVDDRRVHEYDPKLDSFLELLLMITPEPEDELGAVDVELNTYFKIMKVTQQASE